jgi:chromosome segregation ATPase
MDETQKGNETTEQTSFDVEAAPVEAAEAPYTNDTDFESAPLGALDDNQETAEDADTNARETCAADHDADEGQAAGGIGAVPAGAADPQDADAEPTSAQAPLMPAFLTREEYEQVGDDPDPLPEGFEVIDGGMSDDPLIEIASYAPQQHAHAPVAMPGAAPAPQAAPYGAPAQAEAPLPPVQPPVQSAPAQMQKSPQAPEANGPGAAQAVGAFITEGVGAVRQVSAAKRAHASAREELEQLEQTILEQQDELAHRRDIEERYSQIIEEESARQDQAILNIAQAKAAQDSIRAAVDALKEKLAAVREADAQTEKRLKAAVDAAEGKEASSRESGTRLQRRLDDAKKSLEKAETEREVAIDTAQRAIDAAAARLATLREEFAEVQRNPSANSAAYSVRSNELQLEISDAAEELRQAQHALPVITEEVERSLATARAMVEEAKKPIDAAKRAHREVTNEADEARDALDTAKNAAAERQREIRDQIAAQEKAIKEQDRLIAGEQAEADDAQAVMDEANDIHAHPEITEALEADLERNRAERAEQASEVQELADAERDVRQRTHDSRVRFMGAIGIGAAIVLALIVLAWFIFG